MNCNVENDLIYNVEYRNSSSMSEEHTFDHKLFDSKRAGCSARKFSNGNENIEMDN